MDYRELGRRYGLQNSDLVYCAYHDEDVTESALVAPASNTDEGISCVSNLHTETNVAKSIVAVFRVGSTGQLVHCVAEEMNCGDPVHHELVLPPGMARSNLQGQRGILFACYGSQDLTDEITAQYLKCERRFEASSAVWGDPDVGLDKTLFVLYRAAHGQLAHRTAAEEGTDFGPTRTGGFGGQVLELLDCIISSAVIALSVPFKDAHDEWVVACMIMGGSNISDFKVHDDLFTYTRHFVGETFGVPVLAENIMLPS